MSEFEKERSELAAQWLPCLYKAVAEFSQKTPLGYMILKHCQSMEDMVSNFHEFYIKSIGAYIKHGKKLKISTYIYKCVFYSANRVYHEVTRIRSPDYIDVSTVGQVLTMSDEFDVMEPEPRDPDLKADVAKYLKILDDRELDIVNYYYFRGFKLQETGKRLGITRERVRQILMGIKNKIRKRFPNTHYDFNRNRTKQIIGDHLYD